MNFRATFVEFSPSFFLQVCNEIFMCLTDNRLQLLEIDRLRWVRLG